MSKIQQDFVSRSEQDQAILLYRMGRCMAASVVRDRLIANGSGLGDFDLQNPALKTPRALRPLRVDTSSAVQCVLACSLLLCLLSVFALPMETAAHTRHLKKSIPAADIQAKGFAQAINDLLAGD